LITFSNLRAGDAVAFTIDERRAAALLDALIAAGRDLAGDRWQRELVAFLGDRRRAIGAGLRAGLDVGEIAWTPANFTGQREFVIGVCARAAARSGDLALAGDVAALAGLAARYLREHVAIGRRWFWLAGRAPVQV